jgi:hypothetical protein
MLLNLANQRLAGEPLIGKVFFARPERSFWWYQFLPHMAKLHCCANAIT